MKKFLGWLALICMTLVSCFWAFWGVLENFHEGWYFRTLWENLTLMFVQYLLFLIICLILSTIVIFQAKIGAFCIFLASIGLGWLLFNGRTISLYQIQNWLPIFLPCLIIVVGYAWGKLPSRRTQTILTIILPTVLAFGLSLEPLQRISRRQNDGNYESRLVIGNGIELVWAPQGPGWPNTTDSPDWYTAKDICSRLNEDGKTLSPTPVNIWRLPTVEEAVRSMTRYNQNCKGTWSGEIKQAIYNRLSPEKEHPLWDTYSPIIYWWTNTEATAEKAYMIVYHGLVVARDKKSRLGSRAFRAVRDVKKGEYEGAKK